MGIYIYIYMENIYGNYAQNLTSDLTWEVVESIFKLSTAGGRAPKAALTQLARPGPWWIIPRIVSGLYPQ